MEGRFDHNSPGSPSTDTLSQVDEDTLFTADPAVESIFTEADEIDLAGIRRILDIGCGYGGWLHKVARTNPGVDVIGIDINSTIVDHARATAQQLGLTNARFEVMDALQPLQFDAASFDLVNTRSIAIFVHTHQWPALLAECKRILRPGGIMRMAEGEGIFTNKSALDRYALLYKQAMKLTHHSFSPTGYTLANIAALGPLLRGAGFTYVQQKAHTIDFSAGTTAHHGLVNLVSELKRFLLAVNVIHAEELNFLEQEVLSEVQMEDFRALWYVVTAWGEVPYA